MKIHEDYKVLWAPNLELKSIIADCKFISPDCFGCILLRDLDSHSGVVTNGNSLLTAWLESLPSNAKLESFTCSRDDAFT